MNRREIISEIISVLNLSEPDHGSLTCGDGGHFSRRGLEEVLHRSEDLQEDKTGLQGVLQWP
jgi:hypothetical protein